MEEKESRGIRLLRSFLRILPLLGLLSAGLWLLLSGHDFSIETVLSYTPRRPILAALFLLLLFALKSITLMVPVLLLYAVSGTLFPLWIAIPLCCVGTAITLSIPYFIGRGSGPDMTERLQEKHPRLRELREMRSRNELFCAFLIRVVGILPCDVVSLYLGNTRLPYGKYLLGGVLGFLPDIVTAAVAGMKADDRSSPWFWGAIAVNLAVCALAAVYYRLDRKRRATRESAADPGEKAPENANAPGKYAPEKSEKNA